MESFIDGLGKEVTNVAAGVIDGLGEFERAKTRINHMTLGFNILTIAAIAGAIFTAMTFSLIGLLCTAGLLVGRFHLEMAIEEKVNLLKNSFPQILKGGDSYPLLFRRPLHLRDS